MITGILVALPEELCTLTKSKIKQGAAIFVSDNVLVTLAGTGPKNAENAAQFLINQGAKQLISWGCAGALAPHLQAGDLIIPTVIQTQDSTQLLSDSLWSKLIINTLGQYLKCYNGKLIASDTVLALAQEKAKRFQQTGALAVDMESAALANVAPFVAVRSIVDPANLNLPRAINHALTDKGLISIPKLMLYLCRHPIEIPSLIKLGSNFSAANKSLKQAALHLPQLIQVQ